jgi:3'-5' exoribonuclease
MASVSLSSTREPAPSPERPDASAPPQTIATLRPGAEVQATFACARKERQISRAGTPYLTLELRDRTGAITARAFRDADYLAGCFERGDLVRVRGRAKRWGDELQLELQAITRAGAGESDPAAFLPTAYRDLDELEGFLEHLVREVYDRELSALLEAMLADQALRAEIRRAPCMAPRPRDAGGARGGHVVHHAYLGGLLEHTVAVATMCLELCALHPRLDRDLLLSAAIVHDFGKTREFTYGAEIARSEEGRLLGHVELSLRLLAEYAPPSLDPARRLALEHCVMLHHGADTGNGRGFGCAEALALYRLNALDAQVKAALEGPGRSNASRS